MNRSPENLKGWFRSLRSTRTCLNKRKSGNGGEGFTKRDDWIVTKFSFLKCKTASPLE